MRHLVENRWPFRLHATYDETITRCSTCSRRSTATCRSTACTGSSTMPRPSPRGTSTASRAGRRHRHAAPHGLPGRVLRRALRRQGRRSARRRSSACWPTGVPVGAGTDATRVASYNPWVSLSWLVTGQTVGGLELYPRGPVAARPRCGCGPRAAPGSPVRGGQEGPDQGRPAGRPGGAVARTSSASTTKRSRGSSRC